ncbi:MAG: PDZ domain-containing protein [Planctomycetes bacterium]|nr:PDZ domain-containing protein [Planctomycetota bacterium]
MPRSSALFVSLVLALAPAAQETRTTGPATATAGAATQPEESPFRAEHASGVSWRNIGPVNMSGRITALAVHPDHRNTWYVASASGGLWKTTNAGTTWAPVFDKESTVSLGHVAVAPSNPDIVWVGTGEENARNSVSWGDGVYKSVDGGKTWAHSGLRESFQIGHIAIHPTHPDTVYVAALGRLWGENQERGIFRTRDGGKTWEHVLYLDEKTGAIDVRIDPKQPDTVYALLYERKRDLFDSNDPAVRFGKGAGLFRSDDGGETWKKLTRGLPTCQWGRGGLSIHEKDPRIVYLILETERSGWGTGTTKELAPGAQSRPQATGAALGITGEDGNGGALLTSVVEGGAAAAAGLQPGDLITQVGTARIDRYEDLTALLAQARPGDKAKVEALRAGKPVSVELTYAAREAQGPRRLNPQMLAGMLGITGEDAEGAALLSAVAEGGLAAQAGLKDGDKVLQVGDTKVAGFQGLLDALAALDPGTRSKLTVQRGAAPTEIEFTIPTRQGGRGPGGGGPGGRGGSGVPFAGMLNGQIANIQDQQGEQGFETGGVFRSEDRGETWVRVNSLTDRPFYYSKIEVDPQDDRNVYSCGVQFYRSEDGGKTFKTANSEIHVDFHAVWVDPKDGDRLLLGCDGGLNVTYDRTRTWQVYRNLPVGQFYHAEPDASVPYRIYGGLQDNGTWGGPSRTRWREGIGWDDWVTVYGGDGFRAIPDPNEPDHVYATSQNGAVGWVNVRTGARGSISRPRGATLRFNWDTPFFLSPHNSRIVYVAGNRAFRSLDRGQRSELISPELALTPRGTASAFAESPRVPGVLYAGTDDGALWRTKDNGKTWEPLHGKLPMPGPRYISSIHPSRFRDGRVYVTSDAHRSDDFHTYVFVSEDYGDTWTSLQANLPEEPVHVCREDLRNENLLYLGTEFGAYASFDRGQEWFRLGKGLPTVAVRDLAFQDRDSDLIAATHGRGLWILDIQALRELTAAVARKSAHLFAPEAVTLWRQGSRDVSGSREWFAANPHRGTTFYLALQRIPAQAPRLTVHDVLGKEIAFVNGKAATGLQEVRWTLDPRNPLKPGSYSVRCKIGDETLIQAFTVQDDPEPWNAYPMALPSTSAAEKN